MIAAYMQYDALGMTCDLVDPRSYGGNFPDHPRCVPDLLDPTDAARSYPPSAIPYLVFSEKLDPTLVGAAYGNWGASSLLPGVVTATSGSLTVPVENYSQYDTSGRDFRQGLIGTAPPGPSLRIFLGDNNPTVGPPTNSTTQICLGAGLADLENEPLAEPRCVSFHTDPLRPTQFFPAEGDMISASNLPGPFSANFNAPVGPSSATTSNVTVLLAGGTITLPASCYSVAAVYDQYYAVGYVSITVASNCTLAQGMATVTLHAALTDTYGIAMGVDQSWHFTVAP